MGPMGVVVGGVLPQDPRQVSSTDDQHVIRALPRERPAHRRKEQPVSAPQLGALDLPTKHTQLVTQDKHLGLGLRGDSDQPRTRRMTA